MSLYDTPIATLDGKPGALDRPEGQRHAARERRVVLRADAAVHRSRSLQQKYADKGFSVIGLPCNQFGAQEPGTPDEIATFCSTNYNVHVPAHREDRGERRRPPPAVPGADAAADAEGHTGDIRWNFEKFLIGRDGEVVARFSPVVEPEAAEVTEAIEKALAAESPCAPPRTARARAHPTR